MKRRLMVVVSLASLWALGFAHAAIAGEWSPGRGEHNGAPSHARSECVFNGHDDDDEEDNALWAATPSGGVVQSGGQLIAAGFAPPGVQGEACNGHLNPLNG